jgi:hypothetical protein
MLEIMMTKHGNVLMPYSAIAIDEFDQISDGTTVKARITQPRNIRHHNMFFALLQAVFEVQDYFTTLDELRAEITIALGYFVTHRRLDGSTYPHPKSIAFSKMDQMEFSAFFDRAVTFIVNNILPRISCRTTRDDLEARLYTILGEPRPSDLARYSTKGETHASQTQRS